MLEQAFAPSSWPLHQPSPPHFIVSKQSVHPLCLLAIFSHQPSCSFVFCPFKYPQVMAVVHSGLSTLPSTYPGWSPSGHDEKGRIAPHKHKRQPVIEVSDVQLAADDNEGQ